ncbi:MAG: protein kinase [Prochloraceae cyanobacterium]
MGQGGFGTTYLAKDLMLPDRALCVVKQLNPSYKDRSSLELARRLFATEAKILQKLGDCPFIPQLLAYFEEEQHFYLVQQYIEGPPLIEKLIIGVSWPEQKVIKLLQDCLEILEYIHSQGVIHRDIKPANIICTQGDNQLVLVDFGAVKEVVLVPNMTTIPSTVIIGTRGYMSPEQAVGRPHFNSDIYALGKIGIQALTGCDPFEIELQQEKLLQKIKDRSEKDDCKLDTILCKMTQFNFKERYQSAEEVSLDLNSLNNNLPIISKEDSYPNTPSTLAENKNHSQPVNDRNYTVTKKKSVPTKIQILPQTRLQGLKSQTFNRKNSLLALLLIALSSCSGLFLYQQHLRRLNQAKIDQNNLEIIQNIEDTYSQGKYQECIDKAETNTIDLLPKFKNKSKELLANCRFKLSLKQADLFQYSQAIATADRISQNNSFYQQTQNNIATWTQKIIAEAKSLYQQDGDLKKAEAKLQTIPLADNNSLKKQSFLELEKWQENEQQSNSLYTEAERALQAKNWVEAKNKAAKLKDLAISELWQNKADNIINNADREIERERNRRLNRPKQTPSRRDRPRSTPTSPRPIDLCPGPLCNN